MVKNCRQVHEIQGITGITSTRYKIVGFQATHPKFGRYMHRYHSQLCAKSQKTWWRHHDVITLKPHFTRRYVIFYKILYKNAGLIKMVSKWPHWNSLSANTKYDIGYHWKFQVNCHFMNVSTDSTFILHMCVVCIVNGGNREPVFDPLNNIYFSWNLADTLFGVKWRSSHRRIFEITQA